MNLANRAFKAEKVIISRRESISSFILIQQILSFKSLLIAISSYKIQTKFLITRKVIGKVNSRKINSRLLDRVSSNLIIVTKWSIVEQVQKDNKWVLQFNQQNRNTPSIILAPKMLRIISYLNKIRTLSSKMIVTQMKITWSKKNLSYKPLLEATNSNNIIEFNKIKIKIIRIKINKIKIIKIKLEKEMKMMKKSKIMNKNIMKIRRQIISLSSSLWGRFRILIIIRCLIRLECLHLRLSIWILKKILSSWFQILNHQ